MRLECDYNSSGLTDGPKSIRVVVVRKCRAVLMHLKTFHGRKLTHLMAGAFTASPFLHMHVQGIIQLAPFHSVSRSNTWRE